MACTASTGHSQSPVGRPGWPLPRLQQVLARAAEIQVCHVVWLLSSYRDMSYIIFSYLCSFRQRRARKGAMWQWKEMKIDKEKAVTKVWRPEKAVIKAWKRKPWLLDVSQVGLQPNSVHCLSIMRNVADFVVEKARLLPRHKRLNRPPIQSLCQHKASIFIDWIMIVLSIWIGCESLRCFRWRFVGQDSTWLYVAFKFELFI